MNDDNRKQYWEGVCNRTQNLFQLYSNSRHIAYIFCISLGAILIAQGPDYIWGGLWIMLGITVSSFQFAVVSELKTQNCPN